MRAATIVEHGQPLRLLDVPVPTIDAGGALVRVTSTGVCRSDLHVWRGDWSWLGFEFDLPRVPGHEVAGTVEAVGRDVRRVTVGDRVIVPFHVACGDCDSCRSGRSNLCVRLHFLGGSMDGSFAELMAVPQADANCVALPDELDDETGAALGCRYMTSFSAVRRIGAVQPGEWVAVHGAAGGIGLSAVQIATALGAHVIAVDRGESNLRTALDAGAEHAVDAARGEDIAGAVVELSHGGAHVSIDAVATATSTGASVLSLRPGGRHVQVGMTGPGDRGDVALPVDVLVAKELSFLGVTGLPHARYDELMALVQRGRLRPAELVTERVSLDELPDVLARMDKYEVRGFVMVDPRR